MSYLEIEKAYSFVSILKDKYDHEDTILGKKFNIFQIIQKGHEEVSLHSAFLSELLNPEGRHKCGRVFLEKFIDMVVCNETFQDVQSDQFTVTKEKAFKDGRIDILVESNESCLIIENKIYAHDQDAQLARYFDYSNKFKKHIILYLNLYGADPSEQSVRKDESGMVLNKDYCVRSYRDDIIPWLKECANIAITKSYIRENILQYIDLVKKLTNKQEDNMELEMQQYISEKMSEESIDQIYLLADQLDNLRYEKVKGFFSALESKLNKDGVATKLDIGSRKFYSRNSISGPWKSGFFTFKITVLDKFKINIHFWTENHKGNIHASYFCKLTKTGSDEKYNQLRNYLQKNSIQFSIDKKEIEPEIKQIDFFSNNKWTKDSYLREVQQEVVNNLSKIIEILKQYDN